MPNDSRPQRLYSAPRRLYLASRYSAGAAALVFAAVSAWYFSAGRRLGIDDTVYRAGAWAVLHGRPLYGPLADLPRWPGARGLPFTYPPIAALLFAPLILLPLQLAWGALTVPSALSVGIAVRAGLGPRPVAGRVGRAAAVLPAGVFALEPVWRTIGLGQVNAVLMALVVLDVLVLPRFRLRGALTGLAAAVKLTPLVFVLHLAVIGRRADALRALGTFLALNALGAVLLPADTARFWQSQLLGGDHAATNYWVGNQSLNGLLERATGAADWAFPAAVAVGAACIGAALPMARRLHGRGEPMAALLVTACAGLLASPISWSHHWVWVAPAAGLLVRRAAGAAPRRASAGLAVLAVVFSGWTLAAVPSGAVREMHWNPLQMLVGNAYVLTGLGALAVAAGLCLRAPAGPAAARGPRRTLGPAALAPGEETGHPPAGDRPLPGDRPASAGAQSEEM